MALGYLLDPFIQINNINGTPIVGAKIYVYNADTSNLATTYNDFEGHLNTNPVITDDLGNATIIADDGIEYDISVHDENDLLLFTKKYISIDKTSSAGGTTQVAPGYGVTVERVGNTFTVAIDTDLIATKDDLNDKQDKLHSGDNIEITDDNTVNVIGRSELVVQEPLRLTRAQNKLKLYVDNNIETLYKTIQTPAAYGGNTGNYISRIQQNPNGEITCEVSDLSDIAAYQAGDNITIVGHTINSKDWTPELNQKVDNSVYNAYVAEHLDDDNTPYTAGSNITISNHVVSGKDWTSTINNAATTNGWDVTPYVAGSNIAIANHTINGKDWTNTINNAAETNSWDVTPYVAGNFIGITNHTIEGYNWSSYINNAATRNSWDVTPYVASTGISITGHQISCTGDITAYTGGTGISVSNHQISCTGDITPYTAGTGITISNHTISAKNWTSSGFDKAYTKTVTVNSPNLQEVWVNFDNISDYKTWVATGLISSPCICRITIQFSTPMNWPQLGIWCEKIFSDSSKNNIFSTWLSITNNYFVEGGNYTFPCSNDAFTHYGDWNPALSIGSGTGAVFTVGTVITATLELHAVKLV